MAELEPRQTRELEQLLAPGRVLSGPAHERAYDCDAYSVDRSKPQAIVLPESTEEVRDLICWCNENAVPYTPRGAGTGLSGGAMPGLGGLVISMKRMNRILEIDIENRMLRAQTGVANLRITEAVQSHGLHFAPDPSSQSVSTLGGNIAENSGGPHTLKYGVTAQHILQLTLVEPSGQISKLGGLVPGGPGFDLLGVVVGSEGTMGIATEAWVKLTPLPVAVRTALASFPSIRSATETVASLVAQGVIPAALEMMDRYILEALRQAFGLEFPEGTAAMLLIECDGDLASVLPEMAFVERICRENGCLSVAIAKDEAERARMWQARKKGIGAMGRLAPTIVTHDGVIPRSRLPEMLELVYEVSERYGVGVANMFHAGDGNLHPCFYFDDRIPGKIEAVVEAGEEIIRHCVALGGSVTGEHGIGVEKLDLMPLMFSTEDLVLMADVKSIFSTGSLCNPCKVLPNQKGCIEHHRRWRGVAT